LVWMRGLRRQFSAPRHQDKALRVLLIMFFLPSSFDFFFLHSVFVFVTAQK
jgi:hypothetical protein